MSNPRFTPRATCRARTIGLLLACATAPIVTAGGNYELIWSDEFDGPAVDPAKWEFMIGNGHAYGNPGWGNNELQYYTARPENADIVNGELHITARRESYSGYQYTSTRMRTDNRFSFRYGRAEARINLAIGEGLWPAFWMMPEDSVYGGWASSGEIDIMEASDDATHVSGAIHFGGGWPQNTHTSQGVTDPTSFGEEWHVYAVEWEPDQIRWYIDDELYMIRSSNQWYSLGAPGNENAPFDQDFHLLLNMAVGGNFTITPPPDAPFPKTMKVDYVRVYQEQQTPFGGQPASIPGRIEAEEFDEGYQGQAYNDADGSNNGGDYRIEESVDIQDCSEGGYNIGWIEPNEWIEYTVSIAQAGSYDIDARVASNSSGGTFRLLFDGQDVGAEFTVEPTGGWQSWTTVSAQAELPAGEVIMRWENLGAAGTGYNINYFDFAYAGPGCIADLAAPYGVLDLNDINVFVIGFMIQDPAIDFAEPFGVLALSDISAFTASFVSGCP